MQAHICCSSKEEHLCRTFWQIPLEGPILQVQNMLKFTVVSNFDKLVIFASDLRHPVVKVIEIDCSHGSIISEAQFQKHRCIKKKNDNPAGPSYIERLFTLPPNPISSVGK